MHLCRYGDPGDVGDRALVVPTHANVADVAEFEPDVGLFWQNIFAQRDVEEGECNTVSEEALLADNVPPNEERSLYSPSDTWQPLWFQLVLQLAQWASIGAP